MEQLTQGLSLADVVNTQSVTNATVTSLGIDMSRFRRVLFEIQCGSLGVAGTVDANLQSSAQANFNVAHNIASSNITQITQNNARVTIEIRDDQIQAGDRYLRLRLVGGGNAVTVGATGWGSEAEFKPGKANDLGTSYVVQRLVL
jgi:hypothetical protein